MLQGDGYGTKRNFSGDFASSFDIVSDFPYLLIGFHEVAPGVGCIVNSVCLRGFHRCFFVFGQ